MSEAHPWPHKDLLDVSHLSVDEIMHLLDTARSFHEVNRRPVKKVPTLKGKTIMLFFAENSTRTKTSFDVAASGFPPTRTRWAGPAPVSRREKPSRIPRSRCRP